MYQQLKRASMALTLSSVCFLAFAQKTIQGTVKDANGDPMIGVTITDQNGKAGGITDLDGKFTIQNADPNAVLTFSYIGCKPKKVKVGSQKTWNIVLEDDNAALDEVVVVGYGTMRKRDVTGSIASVNSEKIAARGTTNLAESLQGSVPGVNITQSGSRAGAGFNIQVRGQASINKQAQPLYVIDGVVCDNMDFLNPDDIDRIDVLKDASSTAIYGSRASAGVIMITTKGSKGADKAQKATISYDGYYGIKKLARMPEFMDANEFMDYRFARYTTLDGKSYDGSSRKGVDADGHPHYIIKNTDLNSAFLARKGATSYKDSKLYELMMDPSFDGYDWKKMVTRTAAQQNHFISAAGATDKINYRVGMGYQGEENVFKGNDYERFNLKGAMDAKLNKVFDAGFSVNLSMSKTEDVCTDGTYSPYVNAFYFNPFVLIIFISILRYIALVSVFLVFQLEYYFSITVASPFCHRLDGQCHFRLLVSVGRRDLAPVRFACYLPFSLGIDGQGLLVFCAEGTSHGWATNQLMVGSDALEVTPSVGSLVLGDGRLWYFDREIVLGNSLESILLYIGRHVATTNDGVDAVTSTESILPYGFHGLRKDDAFYHITVGKSKFPNALHIFRKF